MAKLTDIEGNEYNLTIIGGQVWMTENLRTTKYNDGAEIPLYESHGVWSSLSSDGFCWYENDSAAYAQTYGALYNWYTIETGKLCPAGWHVPTDNDWKELEMTLGMSSGEADNDGMRGTNEGSKLSGFTGLWTDGALESDAEFGSTGFHAIPGGYHPTIYSGDYFNLGDYGYWWSATESDTGKAWSRFIFYFSSAMGRNTDIKNFGLSVRCVKD